MFRPSALLPYEHVFSSTKRSTIARHALGAARLARSFLLLEDDYEVDWEVGRDEPTMPPAHPHRAPLRARTAPRRAGSVPDRDQVCLCPVAPEGRPCAPSPQTRRVQSVSAPESDCGNAPAGRP